MRKKTLALTQVKSSIHRMWKRLAHINLICCINRRKVMQRGKKDLHNLKKMLACKVKHGWRKGMHAQINLIFCTNRIEHMHKMEKSLPSWAVADVPICSTEALRSWRFFVLFSASEF